MFMYERHRKVTKKLKKKKQLLLCFLFIFYYLVKESDAFIKAEYVIHFKIDPRVIK